MSNCATLRVSLARSHRLTCIPPLRPMKASRFFLCLGILFLAGCTNGQPVACTMDAKVCPDGSAVGRVPPSCEFAACPTGNSSSEPTESMSDGTIKFSYGSKFGLATTQNQIPVNSYIPPCDAGFAYCLYYNQTNYAGTNFESAGVAITNRKDLTTKTACLNTEPDGYMDLKPEIREEDAYATSLFAPLGDAGAGHYATDRLYRISYGTTCYEIRQRIGETQFSNFPAGTKLEFTANDAQNMHEMLDTILESISVHDQPIQFPTISARAAM